MADTLTVYLFGPRPGESIVVGLPDGEWVVIDTCSQAGTNLPLALLRRFDVTRLALAVITHPDSDHYRGFAELLQETSPALTWSFPTISSRRELLAGLARRDPGDLRWSGLSEALGCVEAAMSANTATPILALQSRIIGSVTVHSIAPCPADIAYESRLLRELIYRIIDGKPITDIDGRLLRGEKLDGTGNGLSVGLVIEWNGLRFGFGGDIEAPANPNRGWNGAISYLAAQGREDLLTNLALVKASHHASDGAYSPQAFALHAKGGRPVVIATPFAGGRNTPPHRATLAALRGVCSRLGITAEPKAGWRMVQDAGWFEEPRSDDADASCVMATCARNGVVTVTAYGNARTFS